MNIDIRLPRSWSELTTAQARTAITIVMHSPGIRELDAVMICALRFSGIRLLSADRSGALLHIPRKYCSRKKSGTAGQQVPSPKGAEKWLKFRKFRRRAVVTIFPYEMLNILAREMRWVLQPPSQPWRPDRLMRAEPTAATLYDLTFGQYLELDALHQGYIARKDPAMMKEIIKILVPRARRKPRQWEMTAIIMWLTSARSALARRFPNLYSGTPTTDNGQLTTVNPIQQAFDAQLRALTQGDPLKEDAVLRLPLLRALTELDAQAREYERIKAAQKK